MALIETRQCDFVEGAGYTMMDIAKTGNNFRQQSHLRQSIFGDSGVQRTGFSRRNFLIASGIIGVGTAFTLAGCAPTQTIFEAQGSVPLPIPPLAPSEMIDGKRTFTLTATTGTSQLITGQPEVRTETMGYNGSFLGPTIRAKKGEVVQVHVNNDLPDMTTLHWHGMHIPAIMDGGPHTPIEAGKSLSPEWEINQPAATLWYHPHPHGETEAQVLAGLAGIFIIDDDDSLASGLPSEYGVDDIPLILQDRYLDEDGQIVLTNADSELGTIGDTFLANGVSGTHLDVTTEIVRLRILNGCTARFLDLKFSDGRTFSMIGSDGALLTQPVEMTQLMLTPAERAEILVAFSPNDRVILQTGRPDIPGDREGVPVMNPGDFVEFRAAASLQAASAWHLPADSRDELREEDAVRTRTFELKLPRINGKTMDMERIDAIMKVGDIEIWEVFTTDPYPHNFHLHDVQFRILDINGGKPPAFLDAWKDTIPVLPGEKTRFIVRFEDYTDDKIPYMMHCHLIRHEDDGMMGQFLVTEDGEGPTRIPVDHAGH